MKEYSANMITLLATRAIYGEKLAKSKTIHANLIVKHADRYGTQFTLVLMDGSIIDGRISKKHKFTGRVIHNNGRKVYRSFYAV